MFSYHSSDVRIDETNEADGYHINVEGEHTTAPIVSIKKKVPVALRRLKDFNDPGPCK